MSNFKGLDYLKTNAEEYYGQVPISVLMYISELENHIERSKAPEMLEMLEDVLERGYYFDRWDEMEKLIKEATEL